MEVSPIPTSSVPRTCSFHLNRRRKRNLQGFMIVLIIILLVLMVSEIYGVGARFQQIRYHFLFWLFYLLIVLSCNSSVIASWHPLPSAIIHYFSIGILMGALISWCVALLVIVIPNLDIANNVGEKAVFMMWIILIGVCLMGLLVSQIIFFISKRRHNYFTVNSAFNRQVAAVAYFAADLVLRTRMFLLVSYQPRWLSDFAASALWLFVPPLACFATIIAVFNPMPSKIALVGSILGFISASAWPLTAVIRMAIDKDFLAEYRILGGHVVADYVLGMFCFSITQVPLILISSVEYRRAKAGRVDQDISFDDLALIDDIQIKGKIGAGNFAEVYRGIWQNSVVVALKKLKNNDQALDFMKEATVLQNLNHPHVIRFFGIYISNIGEKYIATEFASKGSLHTLIQKEGAKFSISDLLMMLKHACLGMVYLEKQRVLHRDLSLRNLLVDNFNDRYTIKIADLGLGRQSFEEIYVPSNRNNEMLPVRWSSPEVIQWLVFTNKSDVWSFGVTMWELLSEGIRPYEDMSNKQVISYVLQGGTLLQPKGCPNQIFTLMSKCWEFNANKRPDFSEILEQLIAIIQTFPSPKMVYSEADPNMKSSSLLQSEEVKQDVTPEKSERRRTTDLGYAERFTYDKSPSWSGNSEKEVELPEKELKNSHSMERSRSSSNYSSVD